MSKSTQKNKLSGVNAGAISFGDNSPAHGSLATAGAATAAPPAIRDYSRLLLVVVTDVERRAVLERVRQVNRTTWEREPLEHHTVYRLGRISRTDMTLAQVGPGVITPDAAGAAAGALVATVKPDYLILVGICYGLKDDDPKNPQRLGDVLVANELRLLAHHKVHDAGTEQRGGRVHPSPKLLDRFRSASLDWRGRASVHFGPMVTESVLVDSAEYRRWLRETEPEAIGGEMEGSGIYTAALRGKVDWGLVKGICDWGHVKTDGYQEVAAKNAASLVVHMVRIGGLDPVRSGLHR